MSELIKYVVSQSKIINSKRKADRQISKHHQIRYSKHLAEIIWEVPLRQPIGVSDRVPGRAERPLWRGFHVKEQTAER